MPFQKSATSVTFICAWFVLDALESKFSSRKEAPDTGPKSYKPIWNAYERLFSFLAYAWLLSSKNLQNAIFDKKSILKHAFSKIGYECHAHLLVVCFGCFGE